jgi:hypothetical protein
MTGSDSDRVAARPKSAKTTADLDFVRGSPSGESHVGSKTKSHACHQPEKLEDYTSTSTPFIFATICLKLRSAISALVQNESTSLG